MSNDCINQLVVTGPAKELERFRVAARGVWPWRGLSEPDDYISPLAFTNFVPPPVAAINDYQKVGYRWCLNVLGTKRDAYDVTLDAGTRRLEYLFTTAWSPIHHDLIVDLSDRYPKLRFEYEWDEPGEQFDGILVVKDSVEEVAEQSCGTAYGGRLCGRPDSEEEES